MKAEMMGKTQNEMIHIFARCDRVLPLSLYTPNIYEMRKPPEPRGRG